MDPDLFVFQSTGPSRLPWKRLAAWLLGSLALGAGIYGLTHGGP